MPFTPSAPAYSTMELAVAAQRCSSVAAGRERPTWNRSGIPPSTEGAGLGHDRVEKCPENFICQAVCEPCGEAGKKPVHVRTPPKRFDASCDTNKNKHSAESSNNYHRSGALPIAQGGNDRNRHWDKETPNNRQSKRSQDFPSREVASHSHAA